ACRVVAPFALDGGDTVGRHQVDGGDDPLLGTGGGPGQEHGQPGQCLRAPGNSSAAEHTTPHGKRRVYPARKPGGQIELTRFGGEHQELSAAASRVVIAFTSTTGPGRLLRYLLAPVCGLLIRREATHDD